MIEKTSPSASVFKNTDTDGNKTIRVGQGNRFLNALYHHRFSMLVESVQGDAALAYCLDQLLVLWQANGRQALDLSFDELARRIGLPNKRQLQTRLNKLEQLGVWQRSLMTTEQGRRCLLSPTDDLLAKLPQPAANDAPFYQSAIHAHRYAVLANLCQSDNPYRDMGLHYLLDTLIWRWQNSVCTNRYRQRALLIQSAQLTEICHTSLRTLHRRMEQLINLGLIRRDYATNQSGDILWVLTVLPKVETALKRCHELLNLPTQTPNTKNGAPYRKRENVDIYNNTEFLDCLEKKQVRAVSGEVNNKQKKKKRFANRHTLHTSPIGQPLTPRQHGYLRGMIKKLQAQHGVVLSDPVGIVNEMIFALCSPYFLPDKASFTHRVNVIAKLLRQKRWTTPYGYERYSAKGRAQRAKREAREQAECQPRQRRQPTDPYPLVSSHRSLYRAAEIVSPCAQPLHALFSGHCSRQNPPRLMATTPEEAQPPKHSNAEHLKRIEQAWQTAQAAGDTTKCQVLAAMIERYRKN